MYADVIVLTYQAPDINYFTYKIPEELKDKISPGQLVQVPFGKRNPQGIVIRIHDIKPQTRAKEISNILLGQSLLLPYQIELLSWMSSYYLAPMVNCLEAMLPKIPKDLTRTRPLSFPRSGLEKAIRQSLILVPTINKIPETLAKFPKAKNFVVYHNELKMSEKFAAWQKIKNGETDYIFGSRQVIFTPCPNLKEIIIYNEHDSAYKDVRSPYFDTLTVAQKISGLTGAQIKIVDPAPRITTYFALKNHIKMQQFAAETITVSMQNERLSGNKTSLSQKLVESIGESLEHGGKTLLFLNRKKESGQMFCKNCKHQQYLEKQPQNCPNCKSPDIFFWALNVSSLKKEVQKEFPKTEVNVIEAGFQKPGGEKPSIDIATASVFYALEKNMYALTAYVACDSLLNRADLNSMEELYAQITALKSLTENKGKLILQAFNVENEILEYAAGGDYEKFFQSQIALRRALSYPPFGSLLKLTIKGQNEAKVKTKAEEIFNKLKLDLNSKISAVGPFKPVFWQRKPTYNIILKTGLRAFSLEEKQNAIHFLEPFVRQLSRDCQIIIDPHSIN